VLTCVRPLMRLTRRRPGWEFADQVQIRPTRLKRLSQSWLSRSRPNDRCAIPLLRPSYAPTAPQPRALRRARPEEWERCMRTLARLQLRVGTWMYRNALRRLKRQSFALSVPDRNVADSAY